MGGPAPTHTHRRWGGGGCQAEGGEKFSPRTILAGAQEFANKEEQRVPSVSLEEVVFFFQGAHKYGRGQGRRLGLRGDPRGQRSG